jgi:hypothetical protein
VSEQGSGPDAELDLTEGSTAPLRRPRRRRETRLRRRRAVAALVAVAVAGAGVLVTTQRPNGSDGVTTVVAGGSPSAVPPVATTSGPTAAVTGSAAATAPATAAATGSATGTATGTATTTPRASSSATARRTSTARRTTSAPKPVTTPRLRAGGAPFATRCAVSRTLVPSCGAYWGIYSRRYGGGNVGTTVKTWESTLDRRFDIVLMYYDFSGRNGPGWFPDAAMQNLGQSRILLLDWESRNFATGANYRWADIAAGRYDASVVVPSARRVKAYGRKVMLGLDHEMDLSYAKHGTAAEYRAAYKHLRSVFAAQGVDNVVWTWVTSGYVAYGNGPHVKSFYPGDAYVDWIGYDPYNFNTCHKSGWETFDQTVKGFYDWSAANGLGNKPLLLQEYGMHHGDDAKSRQWYRDIDDVLRKRTRIKALVRWDSDTSCTLRIDSGAGMVAEFRAAGLAVDRP